MQFTEITNKATNIVKTGPGFFQSIIVSGAGSAWTIQIFDGLSSSGIPIFGATAVTVPAAGTVLTFNVHFSAGLTIITAGTTAGELTVTYY